MTQARRARADAVRNRRKILTAARDQIAAHGPDAGVEQIAVAAEVAVGTLYRHSPTKTDLVAAVIAASVTDIAGDAEAAWQRVAAGSRAMDEITAFLARAVESSVALHALKAVADLLGADHGDRDAEDRAGAALAQIIQAGEAAGDLHPDITVDDLYLLFSTAPTDQPPSARARWLSLVLPGLTTQGRPTKS